MHWNIVQSQWQNMVIWTVDMPQCIMENKASIDYDI